jgi:hypothetical protein
MTGLTFRRMTPRRSWRACAAALAACAALALCASPALADGDPASDYLVTQDVFVPLAPVAPSQRSQDALSKLVDVARHAGYGYKVAVIVNEEDLGAITELFGRPQQYARFLYAEIKPIVDGEPHGTLLIVMQRGFGLVGAEGTGAARAALARLAIPPRATPTQLTYAAASALHAIAQANGHPLPQVSVGSRAGAGSNGAARSNRSGHAERWILIGCLLVALLGGALIALGLRTQHAERAGRELPRAVDRSRHP